MLGANTLFSSSRGTYFKTVLALGARAVMVGRTAFWGLAVDGSQGVRDILYHLRDELSDAMENRALSWQRQFMLLSSVGIADLGLILLYQLGVISHLPDFPDPRFDSDSITTSPAAFPFGIPDAFLGVLLLITNLLLVSGAKKQGPGDQIWREKILLVNAVSGASVSVYHLWLMLFKKKRICSYCLGAACLSFLTLSPAWRGFQKSVLKKGIGTYDEE